MATVQMSYVAFRHGIFARSSDFEKGAKNAIAGALGGQGDRGTEN